MRKISEGTVTLAGLAVLAIWLFAVLPLFYLPVASHTPEPSSSETLQSTAAEPKGTAAAPFFVQVIPNPKPAIERAQDEEDREEKKAADRWLVRWTFALFAATIGLILATAVLGYFAYRQSLDMRASIRASTDAVGAALASNQIAVYNAEQRLRAYVSALEVNVRLQRMPRTVGAHQIIDGPVHTYSFSVVLRNGGQTPTRNLLMNFSLQRFTGEMPEEFDFPDSSNVGHGLIGPGSTIQTPEIDVAAKDFENTDAGFRWYVWGWVEYDDVFRGTPRHRTEFCFEARVLRDSKTNEIYIGFPMHRCFNAADHDTMRSYDGNQNKYI